MAAMLVTFLVVSAVLTLIPGPDALLVLRNGLSSRQKAMATGFGVALGALAWGVAASVGIAALVHESATAFECVKWAGAAYLIYLGIRGLWKPDVQLPPSGDGGASPSTPTRTSTWGGGFRSGLISDLLNPKVGLFYVAVLPQVLPKGYPALLGTMIFSGVDAVVAASWFVALAWLAAYAVRWLRRPSTRRTLDRVTGVCLVGLGIRTLLEH